VVCIAAARVINFAWRSDDVEFRFAELFGKVLYHHQSCHFRAAGSAWQAYFL
jgi:hypothetical protein